MGKVNQLKTGVVLSYANLLLGNIIPFFYTPVMISMLGQSEYGLYSLAMSVMGYLQLLNFGIGSTVIRYIAKARAEGDKENEERVIGLFTAIYSVIAVVILAVGIAVSFNINMFYSNTLSGEELERLKTLLLLMTFNTAIFLPLSVFSSIIVAHERYIFNKAIGMITTVAAPLLNLVMLFVGFASVGLVISSTILNILMYTIYIIYCFRRLGIRPRFKNMELSMLREIIGFSFFIFLGELVNILYWSTDKLIIGAVIGTAAVAVYNVGATFNNYVQNISIAISGVLTPKITTMVVKDVPKSELTELFVRIGRLQFIVISFIVSAFVIFGRQFIGLWVGDSYAEAYPVALLVMLPVTIPLIQNTGLSIVIAQNKHRFRAIVYAVIAVLNVILTLIFVQYWGIIGASVATCIAYVIGPVIIMNWYYKKKTGIDIPLFWKNILKMSPLMVVMIIAGLWLTSLFQINNWGTFILSAAVYTAIYCPLAYAVMMNRYEKDIFKKPLMKLLKRGKAQ